MLLPCIGSIQQEELKVMLLAVITGAVEEFSEQPQLLLANMLRLASQKDHLVKLGRLTEYCTSSQDRLHAVQWMKRVC